MSSVPETMIGMISSKRDVPIRPQATKFQTRLTAATDAADRLEHEVLRGSEPTVLADALVMEHAAHPIQPLWESFHVNLNDQLHTIAGVPKSDNGANAFRVEVWMTFRGATDGLRGFWTHGSNSGCAVDEWKLSWQGDLISTSDSTEASDVKELLEGLRDNWFEAIRTSVDDANRDITQHRSDLRAAVLQIIMRRRSRAVAFAEASASLSIPLNPTGSGIQSSIPVRPRRLTLSQVEAEAHRGANEAALASDVADALVKQIVDFGGALERLPSSANRFAGHDEETLRDVLLFVLNANWQGSVTGETFVGAGKTDIHLSWRGREAFIAECKFWHGEQKLRDALDQLLDRYTVWRATRVALVLFIRDIKDVTAVVEKAWRCIERHTRFVGETASPSSEVRSALMKAQTDAGRLVTLTLLPVVIPDKTVS